MNLEIEKALNIYREELGDIRDAFGHYSEEEAVGAAVVATMVRIIDEMSKKGEEHEEIQRL